MRRMNLRGALSAAALAILLAGVTTAAAQPAPPPGRDGGPSMGHPGGPGPGGEGARPSFDTLEMTANSEQLQAELQIGPDQLKQLRDYQAEIRGKQAGFMKQAEEAKTDKERASARMSIQAYQDVGQGMVSRVLKRRQLDRLQQIMVQVEGICIVTRNENLTQALRLEAPAVKKIGEVCQSTYAGIKPIPPGASPKERCAAMEDTRVKMAKAREKVDAQVAKILSEGQAAALRSMQGQPFKMDAPVPPECR